MKPPYHSKGYSRYGAQMGRRSHRLNYDGSPLSLRQVPIDSQGYDPGGDYWGLGAPLWCAWGGEIEIYVRASTRDRAKELVDDELDIPAKFKR